MMQESELLTAIVDALSRYRETHAPEVFDEYRALKAQLFKVSPATARALLEDAARRAGWSDDAPYAKFLGSLGSS